MTSRRGRLTDSRVVIPPDRLSPARLFSRSARCLAPEEIAAWNRVNAGILEEYGLSLGACRSLRLRTPGGRPRGPLETEHRDRLVAAACLSSLAVTAAGRGALLDVPEASREGVVRSFKEMNDRAATCALAEGMHALAEGMEGAVCEIAIGEGVRLKPGEKGGNPTLYVGQTFGDPKLAALSRNERESRGVRTYAIAVDSVEGTTKSTKADFSSGSLFYISESEIHKVPDVYLNKCQLFDMDSVHVDMELPEIFRALAEQRGTDEINIFALKRPRHPLEAMAEMGVNVRIDTDGDAFPVVASGLDWGVFPDNGRPLDGVCGNVGGAAEVIASAAAGHYLGVHTTARFAAKKIRRWEERYLLGPGEAEAIHELGFDPEKVYSTREMVPGIDRKDGAFVASAITDVVHIPLFDGVLWGGNFVEVSVIFVGASGAADLYRLTFGFRGSERETGALLTPLMEKILGHRPEEMAEAVRNALRSPSGARRLRHEFATSYYPHFTETDAKFRLDMRSAEAVESRAAVAFLRALTEAAPDWFV